MGRADVGGRLLSPQLGRGYSEPGLDFRQFFSGFQPAHYKRPGVLELLTNVRRRNGMLR